MAENLGRLHARGKTGTEFFVSQGYYADFSVLEFGSRLLPGIPQRSNTLCVIAKSFSESVSRIKSCDCVRLSVSKFALSRRENFLRAT